MVLKSCIYSLIIACSFIASNHSKDFYKALFGTSQTVIDRTLNNLEKQSVNDNIAAYKGGLLMKKSEFLKTPKEKIDLFKKGRAFLESSINNAPKNAEYRFIRLTIQEHAPKILKYNRNISEDKSVILSGFSKMAPDIQKYVLDYAKQSDLLKTEELLK